MPMNPVVEAHVVADENDLGRPELQNKVKGVKAAVAAPAQLAEPFE